MVFDDLDLFSWFITHGTNNMIELKINAYQSLIFQGEEQGEVSECSGSDGVTYLGYVSEIPLHVEDKNIKQVIIKQKLKELSDHGIKFCVEDKSPHFRCGDMKFKMNGDAYDG